MGCPPPALSCWGFDLTLVPSLLCVGRQTASCIWEQRLCSGLSSPPCSAVIGNVILPSTGEALSLAAFLLPASQGTLPPSPRDHFQFPARLAQRSHRRTWTGSAKATGRSSGLSVRTGDPCCRAPLTVGLTRLSCQPSCPLPALQFCGSLAGQGDSGRTGERCSPKGRGTKVTCPVPTKWGWGLGVLAMLSAPERGRLGWGMQQRSEAWLCQRRGLHQTGPVSSLPITLGLAPTWHQTRCLVRLILPPASLLEG